MGLRLSYTVLAPLYDLVAGPAFRAARRDSLAALPRDGRHTVLVNLDFLCVLGGEKFYRRRARRGACDVASSTTR